MLFRSCFFPDKPCLISKIKPEKKFFNIEKSYSLPRQQKGNNLIQDNIESPNKIAIKHNKVKPPHNKGQDTPIHRGRVLAKHSGINNSNILKRAAYQCISPLNKSKDIISCDDNEKHKSNILDTRSNSLKSIYPYKYKAYNLNDYTKIKPDKYFILGGLGPNLGGKDWQEKTNKIRKAINYSELVKKYNKNLKLSTDEKIKQLPEYIEALKMKEKIVEYSKRVPRPKITEPEEYSYDKPKNDKNERLINPFLYQFQTMDNNMHH